MTQPESSLLQRLRQQVDQLAPAMQQLARHMLDQPRAVLQQSVQELARAAQVPDATVTRLSRKLGCTGFPDLKIKLSAELAQQETAPKAGDPLLGVSLQHMVTSMYQSRDTLDAGVLQQVIASLVRASRIEIAGEGNSQLASRFLLEKLLKLGLPASSHADPRVMRLHASTLGKSGVLLAFSRSGSTPTVLEYLKLAHQGGALTVLITHSSHPVPDFVSCALVLAAPEQAGSVSALIGQLWVAEVICEGVARKRL